MNYSFFAPESTKSIECIENANCIKTILSPLLYPSLPFSTFSTFFTFSTLSTLLSLKSPPQRTSP